MNWEIYTLSDPSSGAIRYLGVTRMGVKKRFSAHLSDARTGKAYRNKWIRSILSRGDRPVYSTIESGFGDGWKSRECYWIAHMRNLGVRLTNLTDGGEGTHGLVATAETCAKIRAAKIGHSVSPETRAKLAAANLGKRQSLETCVKMSVAHLGKKRLPFSLEHRARMSESQKGKRRTSEHCAKISAALRRRVCTPETRAKIGAAHHGRVFSLETRAKMSTAARSRKKVKTT